MKSNYLYLLFLTLCAPSLLTASQLQQSAPRKTIDHALDRQLLAAVEKGDLAAIQKLFANDTVPDINAKNNYGYNALMEASGQGHTAIVQALIAAGADLNAKGKFDNTALIVASTGGHTAVVQALIDAGADINGKNIENTTALSAASGQGHTAIVHALIAAGADLNVKSNDGFTALIGASIGGYTAIVQALIAAGADLNTKNKNGNTALMAASDKGYIAIVRALIAAGAYETIENNRGRTARYFAPDRGLFDKTVAAAKAAYSARQAEAKKIIEEQRQLIPAITDIIAGYAYGPSIADLPESLAEEETEEKARCIIQ